MPKVSADLEDLVDILEGLRLRAEEAESRLAALETALSDCVTHMKTAGSREAVRAAEAAGRLLSDA